MAENICKNTYVNDQLAFWENRGNVTKINELGNDVVKKCGIKFLENNKRLYCSYLEANITSAQRAQWTSGAVKNANKIFKVKAKNQFEIQKVLPKLKSKKC